jgi:acyl carrier protein
MEFEIIRRIISEQQGINGEEITPVTTFAENLSMDSLDVAQMLSEIEDFFGIEADIGILSKIKTVGDAAAYIKSAI